MYVTQTFLNLGLPSLNPGEQVDSWTNGLRPNRAKQVCIHEISRSPSSFLPAEKKRLRIDGRSDGPTDGRTHPLIESWLTTENEKIRDAGYRCEGRML